MQTARRTYSSQHYDDGQKEIISDLVYINYAHNRDISPEISPERWSQIYGDTTNMEARYRKEKSEFQTMQCAKCSKTLPVWEYSDGSKHHGCNGIIRGQK